MGFTEFYWVLLGFTEFLEVPLGGRLFRGCQRVVLGFQLSFQDSISLNSGFDGFYRVCTEFLLVDVAFTTKGQLRMGFSVGSNGFLSSFQ